MAESKTVRRDRVKVGDIAATEFGPRKVHAVRRIEGYTQVRLQYPGGVISGWHSTTSPAFSGFTREATTKIQVPIRLTVEVDAESWALNYGTESEAATRADVVQYVRAMLADAPVPMVAQP